MPEYLFMLALLDAMTQDDVVNVWNLRKCSAAGMDILSNVYGDEILSTLMPLIQVFGGNYQVS